MKQILAGNRICHQIWLEIQCHSPGYKSSFDASNGCLDTFVISRSSLEEVPRRLIFLSKYFEPMRLISMHFQKVPI